MDARSFRALEYAKIINQLTQQAATAVGKERCQGLQPHTDVAHIRQRLAETTQARRLLETVGTPPWGGATDIRPLLQQAKAEATLEPHELLAVGEFVVACRRLLAYFQRSSLEAPALFQLASPLHDYGELEGQISHCISDDGQVKPDASNELIRLHHRADTLRERLHNELEGFVDEYTSRGWLQDPLIVQRSGRWCVPVLTQYQSRFPGIVHDRSGSGATVFMEPTDVVELGNDLRSTELAIDEEIHRVLGELTLQVAAHCTELSDDIRQIGLLDFIFAKGQLSRAHQATEPEITDKDGYINFNSARHPLLTGEVVPIDLWIGRDFTTLIITGPNTGGKTVTLKTVGLLTLMAQSGLHVPAEPGTKISVFDAIYADIGEEQSIEQSLSTFSSHMTQIVKIINRVKSASAGAAGVNALVLLDEIGAGTDPAEGSALARATLEYLHSTGCRTIVTTHYNDLKAFAYAQDGMQNAAVQFDPESLQPTYQVVIGHPGPSNAFEIAQHLGLSPTLVHRSQQLLGQRRQDFTEALQQVHATQRQLQDQHHQAAQTSRELEELRQQYRQRFQQFQEERQQVLAEAYTEADQIIASAQQQAQEIIQQLQQQSHHTARSEELRTELKQARQQLRDAQARQQEQLAEQLPAPADTEPLETVVPGDHVYVPAFNRQATVLEVPDEETALIQVGNIRIEVNISDLHPSQEPTPPRTPHPGRAVEIRKQMTVDSEIDLRGQTTQEARQRLEKYLDDVMLAGLLQVRIVHGKGTGALREAIHDYLRQHAAVRDFRLAAPEAGGEGATEVVL